jgi:hypothetical protein
VPAAVLAWRSVPAAVATPSWSPVAARAAQQAQPRQRRPALRFGREAPNQAVARTPCSDLPDARASQPVAACWQRLVAAATAREQRPAEAPAQVLAETQVVVAQQQPSS